MGFPMGVVTVFGVPTPVFTYIVISMAATVGCCNILLFEDRYNTLVGNSTWKTFRVPFHIFNFTTASLFLFPQYEFYVPVDQKASIAACPYFPCNHPIPNTTFVLSESIWYLTGCIIVVVTYGVSTGLYFAAKIHIYIKNRKNQSVNLKRMQQKLQTALILQCLIPIWSLAVPLATIAFIIFLQVHNQIYNNFVFATMSSHGTWATITMLLVHEPYKKFAFQWFYIFTTPRIQSATSRKSLGRHLTRVGTTVGSLAFI
uniref:Serpentine Receptor, class H n=1 Tax=Caenorhabditis japonica TaxID=281687 RepID=A0A8R1DQL9_CAEJA